MTFGTITIDDEAMRRIQEESRRYYESRSAVPKAEFDKLLARVERIEIVLAQLMAAMEKAGR